MFQIYEFLDQKMFDFSGEDNAPPPGKKLKISAEQEFALFSNWFDQFCNQKQVDYFFDKIWIIWMDGFSSWKVRLQIPIRQAKMTSLW